MIHPLSLAPRPSATLAGRAVGAMFFAGFGGMWLAYGCWQALPGRPAGVAGIILIAATLLALAYRQYLQHREALAALEGTPEQRRRSRMFNLVNAAQWVLIFVLANVLGHLHLQAWVLPAALFVVGLHFLPLARVFGYRAHYLTGAAMMLLAVGFPLLAPAGPLDPIGPMGAGLILWAACANNLLAGLRHARAA